jgi:hypothetical protein
VAVGNAQLNALYNMTVHGVVIYGLTADTAVVLSPAVRSGQMHTLFMAGRAMEASVVQAEGQEAEEA